MGLHIMHFSNTGIAHGTEMPRFGTSFDAKYDTSARVSGSARVVVSSLLLSSSPLVPRLGAVSNSYATVEGRYLIPQ
jgi:hypothetical protein